MADRPLAFGVAGRAYPNEPVSGDAHAIHWTGNRCRIAVIDGLGHGIEAAEAAACAVQTLDAHPLADPRTALERCHVALHGTRGAAISIAQIDLDRQEITYAGIGNVEAHVWQAGRHERLIAYRGIVGSAMRTIRTFTTPIEGAWTLLLHSDGLSARADIHALGLPLTADPTALAEALLERYGRQLDDALAVVVQPRS